MMYSGLFFSLSHWFPSTDRNCDGKRPEHNSTPIAFLKMVDFFLPIRSNSNHRLTLDWSPRFVDVSGEEIDQVQTLGPHAIQQQNFPISKGSVEHIQIIPVPGA